MPFFGGRSIYKISGSNVIGGITSLPINTGNDNVAIGNNVLQQNTTGSRNIGVGNFALNAVVDGSDNIAIGKNAGFAENSSQSIFIGTDAGFTPASTASVMIGYEAGKNINAIDASVIIGGDFKIEAGGSADVLNYSVLIASNIETASADMSAFVNSSVFIGRQAQVFGFGESFEVLESVTIGGSLNFDTRKRVVSSVDVGFDAGVDCESDFHVAVGRASLKGAYGNNIIGVGNRAGSILAAPIDNGIFLGDSYTSDYGTFASFENVFVAGYFTEFGRSYPGSDPKPVSDVILIGDSFYTFQDASVNNTVILGYGNDFADYTGVENAVLIGSNILTGAPDGSLDDCIIIGGGNVKNDNLKIIQIGNRNATYDEIWFGDQQYTGGGGGFSNNAEQTANDDGAVSIESNSTDSNNNISAGYSFLGDAPNDDLNAYFYLEDNLSKMFHGITASTSNGRSTTVLTQAVDMNSAFFNSYQETIASPDSIRLKLYSECDSAEFNSPSAILAVEAYDLSQPDLFSRARIEAGTGNVSLKLSNGDNSSGNYSILRYENDLRLEQSDDGININAFSINPKFGFYFEGESITDGAETPALGSNAPVAGLTITKWIKTNIDGVDGYIPFFSVPI